MYIIRHVILCHDMRLISEIVGIYRIVGYFRGMLIFVIFVVNPGVTKFSNYEIFYSHCSSVYTC